MDDKISYFAAALIGAVYAIKVKNGPEEFDDRLHSPRMTNGLEKTITSFSTSSTMLG